ncbi:MAG: HAD-IB family hydrolase [Nitriliruptorales bacterium]|nr:HAD-IB family hydrolase [Nitriliruptorales bacterium]
MVRRALAGQRLLVTGVTGFVGQAVLERVLSALPDTRVAVLARPRDGLTGRVRIEQLLHKPIFDPWRECVGDDGVAHALHERVTVLEGDLSDGPPALPHDLDAVIHCAATVSFDPQVDHGFRTNLLGAVHLYEALRAAGSRAHLVHVSTAYVAGVRKGVVSEGPLSHAVDWRVEADAALAARTDVERDSRRPDVLDRLMAEARKDHARAGPQTVAEDAERRRREWVDNRLVDYGRARAHSLGWPDVYTLTKALAERAAEEVAGDLALSIVRPSIVESALIHPYPGWIEGFKMAEPLILAYGRGALPEFLGVADGVVDIIPVDLVANALIAVAANPPEPPPGAGAEHPERRGGRAYYHVSSGDRNPLSFRRLYEHVRTYFRAHPLPERDRGEVKVPEWSFPGRFKVERMLRTGERLVDLADRSVARLPRSSRTRDWLTRIHRERQRLDFIRRYADLYGAYAEAEVIYTDSRALALHRSLPEADRELFGFDSAVIDWAHYLREVHCPSVTAALRAVVPRRGSRTPEPESGGEGVLAVFDLEGTILTSNVVESYVWVRLADLPASEWPAELASVARMLPRLLATDRRDRGEFLRAFYRRYEGCSVEGLRRLVAEHAADMMLQRAAPEAIRRVRRHRAAGHRTVLITGALDPLIEPLRPLFDVVVATRLAEVDGRYTGYLAEPPLVGEARAAWLRRYAMEKGVDLGRSWGYGDSHSDLPLLEAVGNPVAVNPDTGLYRAARRRRWPVAEWDHPDGTSRLAIPVVRR